MTRQSFRTSPLKISFARAVFCALVVTGFAHPFERLGAATSYTYSGPDGGTFNTPGNWTPSGGPPGVADTATFTTALTSILTGAANPAVLNIIFDANAGTANGTFTLASSAGGPFPYQLQNGGTTQILSTLTGTGKTITFSDPVVLVPASATAAGAYSFLNNSADPTNTLNFSGGVSGGTTNKAITLTLGGANTGANTISGVISNFSASSGVVNVSKNSDNGTWILSGNNTYTGTTSLAFKSGTTSVLAGIGSHAFGSTSGITLNSAATLSFRGDTDTTFSKASDGTLYTTQVGNAGVFNATSATAGGTNAKTMTIGTITTGFKGSGTGTNTFGFVVSGSNNTSLTTGSFTGPTLSTNTANPLVITLTNNIAAGTGAPAPTTAWNLGGYTSGETAAVPSESVVFAGAGNTNVTAAITQTTSPVSIANSGTGTLTIAFNNAAASGGYTGGTTSGVAAGNVASKVVASSNGALGSGGVTINGTANLTINSGVTDAIANSANISLASNATLTLSGTGGAGPDGAHPGVQEIVNGLIIGGAGQTAGIYGPTGDTTAQFQIAQLTAGSAELEVLNTVNVPEPRAWVMTLAGLAGVLGLGARRRCRA